jgi:hypothetical protein
LASLAPLQQSRTFAVRLDDVVLVDLDGDEATRQDQVRANGQLSFEPRLEFDLKMKGFQIQEITVAAGATEEVRLEIEGDLAVSFLNVRQQVDIARYYFQPLTIWVGWVPVVFAPVLDVRVGLDGSATVSFQTSVSQEATVRAGLSYNRGTWLPIAELTNEFLFAPPELTASAGVRGYAGLELGILIYGLGGPQAALDGFLELDADLNRQPWLELYGGLRAEAGIRFEILGYRIADHSLTVLDEKVLLASSEAPPRKPTTTLAPTLTPAPTPTTAPTSTATPAPTPTWTPTAGCAIEAQGAFAELWQAHRARLGCPLSAEAAPVQDAEQAFENGRMLWRKDISEIYVIYGAGPLAGTYETFVDTWLEGDLVTSCAATPPAGRLQPVRGFGRVWCQLGAASAAIGWGLEEEAGFWAGNGDPLVQDFLGGTVFRDSAGTAQGLAYLLFRDDGSFVQVAY